MKSISLIQWTAIFCLFVTGCDNPNRNVTSRKTDSEKDATKGMIVTRATSMRASDASIAEYMNRGRKNGRIDKAVAQTKLVAFKLWADIEDDGDPNQSIDFKNANYGHLFSFDELYAYLDSINTVNQGMSDPKDKIDGIRIYNGATYYKDGFVPELFLFPTKQKKNIHDIDIDYPSLLKDFETKEAKLEYLKDFKNFQGDGSGYNNSLPCPQSCP